VTIKNAFSHILATLILATASSASAETFSLLTYNVKGLPLLVMAGDGPTRITNISQHLKNYDLVLLQEIFAYRDLIRSSAKANTWIDGPAARFRWNQIPALVPLYIPCKLSRFCEMPSSAGLAVMTFHPAFHANLLVSQHFSNCHGVLRSANDCVAAKGLVGVEVSVSDHRIHVYTTHLDAGRSSKDQNAREQQLKQLAQAIGDSSKGHAMLVGGDFNLRRDNRRDMTMLATFLSATGLANSGAFESPDCSFGCQGLDYILYRSGERTLIEITHSGDSQAAEFVDGTGTPLSDHPPLVLSFTLQQSGSNSP
jgi:endonuclease/exonuclease/phosphatase family metal-dependent hydrolase